MLTLRAHDIMIFGGVNGKLASKNLFWKWISCTEGENDELLLHYTVSCKSWKENQIILFINLLFPKNSPWKYVTSSVLKLSEKNQIIDWELKAPWIQIQYRQSLKNAFCIIRYWQYLGYILQRFAIKIFFGHLLDDFARCFTCLHKASCRCLFATGFCFNQAIIHFW